MLERDAAPGIHRVEDVATNWYLVEDDGAVTVVDAGVPKSWRSLQDAMAELGRPLSDIKALVLTHAHFDHIGFAERARDELGIPVWVHEDDVPLTRHPTQYAHESARTRYLLTKPQALPYVLGFVRTRAFFPKPIERVERYSDGTLDVPGSPRVVATPGHTIGHCSLLFGDTLIAGDAVVTLNPYTGGHGPQIVARAATADSERALASLDAVEATGADTVLTGHGPPWTRGAVEIAAEARAVGPT
jgi:glyoxylase-like metal-dependent hydrolase (beta-lactamase superfamily II)